MKKVLFFLFVVGFFGTVSGQVDGHSDIEIISHQVQQGETIRLLSLKYLATPSDIYKLNKFAIEGIRQGMVLQIPVRKKPSKTEKIPEPEQKQFDRDPDAGAQENTNRPQTERAIATTHHVVQGETLSAIARLYGVTLSELNDENQHLLKRGLQSGQVLKIPKKSQDKVSENVKSDTRQIAEPADTNTQFIEHVVEPKETLYSISRKYNVSVDVLKDNNEKLLAQGLKAGQVIKIKPNN